SAEQLDDDPADDAPAPPITAEAPIPSARRSWFAYGVGTLLLLGVVVATVFQWGSASRLSAGEVQAGVPLAAARLDTRSASVRQYLPAIYLKVDGRGEAAERLAAVLRRGLAGFDTVSFIAREPDPVRSSEHLKTDFV